MTTKKETIEKKYNYYNDEFELYGQCYTEKEFMQDVRYNGEDEDAIYYRVPVEALEKIQVKSQIIKIK